MVALVYDFLNVSRMELGTFTIKLSTFKVEGVGRDVLKECLPLIKQKNLKITEKYEKNTPLIEADKKIIRIILQNLISNAVKYTPAKGKVTIAASFRKHQNRELLHLTVSDTGYGIPKNQQSKVFTKLFRADNAVELDTEGSGLGLYIVKSFVDFCQGGVTFTSKKNKGTVFYVDIPVKSVRAEPMALKGGAQLAHEKSQ